MKCFDLVGVGNKGVSNSVLFTLRNGCFSRYPPNNNEEKYAKQQKQASVGSDLSCLMGLSKYYYIPEGPKAQSWLCINPFWTPVYCL